MARSNEAEKEKTNQANNSEKNASDDPNRTCRISTWAPQNDLNADQMIDPRSHSNFAPTGTGLNLFRWISKKLDGLDWNLMTFYKEHKNEQRDYLEALKNLEKIPNNPRNIRRLCLWSFWRVIWWSGVGHLDGETVAGCGWCWDCWNRCQDLFSSRERTIPLYTLTAFGERK